MALGTIGTNQIASEAVTVPKVTDQVLSSRNLVINGSCKIHQRGGTTGITNANSGYYGPDRFKFNEDGTMTAVVSIERETLTSGNAFNDGNLYAYKLSVTTADTAVAADIYTRITHRFEKDNLASLSKGTSSAKSVTLSFWVKATVTGTNVVEFFDQVNSRQVGATYTISSSNTWEYKTVTFPADTSGALGSGNGLAAEINFVLQAGSNYTSGTLDTSWASETAANRAAGHNSNHFSSTSNTFHFTAVQLEVGVATPFEHRSFGDELLRCQRYLYRLETESTSGAFANLTGWNTNDTYGPILYPVEMRAAPTLSIGAEPADFLILSAGTNPTPTELYSNGSSKRMMELRMSSTGNIVAGRAYWGRISDDTNGFIQWDAEL